MDPIFPGRRLQLVMILMHSEGSRARVAAFCPSQPSLLWLCAAAWGLMDQKWHQAGVQAGCGVGEKSASLSQPSLQISVDLGSKIPIFLQMAYFCAGPGADTEHRCFHNRLE